MYGRFLALTSKFDLVPAEFLVIPISHADNAGEQQEVEPPRLLGAALDPHRGQESAGGKEDPNSKHDFVELSLEPNSEGSSDLLRSPAGPDGQRRRNRTDTMIFSEAVNIAEDLAKAQTDAEPEGSTPFTEVPAIDEVAEVPFISEDISSAGDAAPVPSDLSLEEFDDQVLTDEVEEIPLPSIVDLEPAVHEDSGEESSDEEVVPEEEILDPTVAKLPISPELPGSELPLTVATEPSPSETASNEKEPEPTDIPEPVQSTPEASEPPAEVEVTPATTDDGEDVEEDEEDEEEEESTSPLEPPPPVTVGNDDGDHGGDDGDDDDDDGDDDEGPQPANQPEAGS